MCLVIGSVCTVHTCDRTVLVWIVRLSQRWRAGNYLEGKLVKVNFGFSYNKFINRKNKRIFGGY